MDMPWYKEPTRGQWATFIAAWAGWVMDAFDFTIFLLVMPAIAAEFGASLTSVAGIVTLTLLVRLIGGYAAGAAADKWGRKTILLVSIIWFALCDGAVAFAPSFTWVLVLRVLFGFGMGAEWTGGTTLAMENWPERSRGIASGILQGSWAIGYLLAAVVSAWIVPRYGWRALFIVAALPALLVIPMRYWVPESKDWKKAKTETAKPKVSLLRGKIFKRLVWASAAMTLGFAVYYGLTSMHYTLMTTELGISHTEATTHISLFNIGMMGGAIVCGIVVARKGVAAAVVPAALLMVPLLPLFVGRVPSMMWLGALLGGAVGVGWSGVVPAFLTALFPAEVRARCVGITYHVGAFFAALIPTLIAFVWERTDLSLGTTILIVAAVCEVGLAALILIGPREIGATVEEVPVPVPSGAGALS